MQYIHQLDAWHNFIWDQARLSTQLAAVRHKQGLLLGKMRGLGFSLRDEAVLQTLTQDVLKSSEIEGQVLDQEQVRSSIARRLGIDIGALAPIDRNTEGVVEMKLDATQNFGKPLTDDRMFAWHGALFPTGRSGMNRIKVAQWRDETSGPMQVVSGPYGKQRVHFEAPEAKRLDHEMSLFLDWLESDGNIDLVLKAGIAHLCFLTIHPFEDGNGRIARAIADMVLARSENDPQRFYSMSAQIQAKRNAYYDMLEATQKGNLDIIPWLQWFLDCLDQAIDGAETTLSEVLKKAHFWEKHTNAQLNDRQRNMLGQLLDGFKGRLTTSKWAKITKCSQDTALRDISDLLKQGILEKNTNGGRSTSYSLIC